MTAQILKLTLLPDVDATAFERTLRNEIFPKIQILRRNVAHTSHRLFRADRGSADSIVYVWLVFTDLVGSTPQTAGEGPTILCESELPLAIIASHLANLATVESLSEI
jgi:hypothetical protein